MLIGYTTWGMPNIPVDQALFFLHQQGFDAVELTVLPGYTTAVDKLSTAERQRIKRLFTSYEIEMPAVAAHRSLLDDDPSNPKTNMHILTQAIDLCGEWNNGQGKPVLDTILGGIPTDWENRLDFIFERVQTLVDYAEGMDVVIGIEGHVGSALDTAEKCIQLVEEISSPYLGLNFDISHFDVIGMSIENAVHLMAPYTVHTHVKDQRGRLPDYEFLIPGDGDFDFVTYLLAMEAAGYQGSITAEVSNMVQIQPGYNPFQAASLCYETLNNAFNVAQISRG